MSGYKLIIVPGYGDRDGYIYRLTKRWLKRYGLAVEVARFGWRGDPRTYDQKWQAFSKQLAKSENAVVLGISAGASVALRALHEQPKRVKGVISVCGPWTIRYFHRSVLHRDYPTLESSLDALQMNKVDRAKVMTLRPLYDESVPPQAVYLEEAKNVRMPFVLHAVSIVLALVFYGRTIRDFVKTSYNRNQEGDS